MEMTESYTGYIEALKSEIKSARVKAALSVNKELILLYWKIGKSILEMQEKEGWGAKVIEQVSKDLRSHFPEMKGLSTTNMHYMRKFALTHKSEEFLQEAPGQITWYHNTTLLDKIDSPEERLWYAKKTIENGWSRNVLVMQIESNLYERQSGEAKKISNFSRALPSPQSDLAQNIMKDPYNFEFLGLSEEADERKIEKSLEDKISKLLLEMGTGFAYMGRQYPLHVGGQDFWLDMLFYNVKLRSYVVVELKAHAFKPADAGQLNFYLTAIDREIKHETDNPTIGLVICKSKNGTVAEYALDGINKPMGVSEFRLKDVLPEEKKIEEVLSDQKED